jgi:hypothetical protein
MVEPLRHRQTKGAETDMPGLPPPRHFPTLPRAAIRGSPRPSTTSTPHQLLKPTLLGHSAVAVGTALLALFGSFAFHWHVPGECGFETRAIVAMGVHPLVPFLANMQVERQRRG